MRKICFAIAILMCCDFAFAFDFDPVGAVKKMFGSDKSQTEIKSEAPGFTSGFSRDDRLNVVMDDVYKLMWQDGADIFKGNWDEAKRYCENLNFAGFNDWRLPTINELFSITDDSRYNPAINKAFKYVNVSWYWSSTMGVGDLSEAWVVPFRDGDGNWLGRSVRNFVRCVRQY